MWIAETQDDEIDKFFSSAKKTNDMQPRRKYVRGEKLLSRLGFLRGFVIRTTSSFTCRVITSEQIEGSITCHFLHAVKSSFLNLE